MQPPAHKIPPFPPDAARPMASPAKLLSPSKPPEDAPAEEPRLLLRRRWELAAVLNFFMVFEPVIQGNLGLSAEEIETALISNNRDLARIHISLLKGIPPVKKNLNVNDGWVRATAKELSNWWSWVAEGTNPFKRNPGKEVETYKEQDPISRLFILKALCEVRSEQKDAVCYVHEELDKGVDISNFRREKFGSASDGTTYWYVGDSTIGHRLYKENVTVEFKEDWKGEDGHLTKPVTNIHWETVAANLDEFLDISEKLCSKGRSESAIGEHLKENIVPAVEKFQKSKERGLKGQQKKTEGLAFADDFKSRSLRERKTVNYSDSDYDRSIEEAIKLAAAKEKESDSRKDAGKKEEHAKYLEVSSDDNDDDDDEVSDYNDKDDSSSSSDGDSDASDPHKGSSDEEDVVITHRMTRLASRHGLDSMPRQGLRRSRRNIKDSE